MPAHIGTQRAITAHIGPQRAIMEPYRLSQKRQFKLLVFWYSQQQKNIRWSNTVASSFHVTNGVKQGGIISPVLFNVYMDDLSISLNNSGIGGHIGEKTINHLCYADDICLVALSSSAMQQLLNICHIFYWALFVV